MASSPQFVGARLREIREVRGITVPVLASHLNLSKKSLYAIEAGKYPPLPDTIRRLALTLEVPVNAFMISTDNSSSITKPFFRSRKRTLISAYHRATQRICFFSRVVKLLYEYFDLKPANLPQPVLAEKVLSLPDLAIATLADELRQFWGLTLGPISNLTNLLEVNRIFVARSTVGESDVDAFSIWDRNLNTGYVMLSTDKQSPFRSRFDAAHELGHLVLHRQIPDEWRANAGHMDLLEHQANSFAAAFLLPTKSFPQTFNPKASLDQLCSLKAHWRVSVAAILHRAHSLTLISDLHYVRLCKNLAARGWKKQEPFDDSFKPEEPHLISKCFESLFDKGMFTEEELELRVGLFPKTVEGICGLPSGFFRSSGVQAPIISLQTGLAKA